MNLTYSVSIIAYFISRIYLNFYIACISILVACKYGYFLNFCSFYRLVYTTNYCNEQARKEWSITC